MSKKGVIYARYSSDSQREESIEGQLRECMVYAEREGITLLSPYIDRALSARTDNRPNFQKMIKDSSKGLFDIVIVWKLDRFARNRYDSAHYKSILRKNGVQVISATENISDRPDGILMEAVLEGMAEYYSAELSEKVRRGLTENALKGVCNGGNRTYGLQLDENRQYKPDPLTSPFVYESFRMYDEGHTMVDIIKYLNENGVRTQRGNKVHVNFVTRMLHNRKYKGDYVYGDHVLETAIQPIVPADLFDRVQHRLKKNKKSSARFKAPEHYLLTTKLFCGYCGFHMAGESGTSHTGFIHHYYKCSSHKRKKGCKKKPIKKDAIEKSVIDYTKRLLLEDHVIDYIADVVLSIQAKENDNIPFYKQQLAETNRAIENVLNAIQQGIFNVSTKQRLDELEERKSELEVSIIQAELEAPKLTKKQILFWLLRFRSMDTSDEKQCERLIDSFVNAVYVFDDKLVLTFNYKEGAHTVTLDQAKGSDIKPVGALRENP